MKRECREPDQADRENVPLHTPHAASLILPLNDEL